MKIAFHTPQIDVRGSCVSLYDYAHYNETLLQNKSVIVVPTKASNNFPAFKKFAMRFQIIQYDTLEDLEEQIKDCDILYCIKYGKNDGFESKKIKTVVHCVFDVSQHHGKVYAAVSRQLAAKFNYSYYVPHMIGLKPSKTGDNMRSELSIPKTDTVFGRHGEWIHLI